MRVCQRRCANGDVYLTSSAWREDATTRLSPSRRVPGFSLLETCFWNLWRARQSDFLFRSGAVSAIEEEGCK